MTSNNEKDLVLLAVFTFITVSAWIFFELVKTAKTTTVTSAVSQIIVPLSPKIDTETLTNLENRKEY